jgi:hypothetical protein
MRNQCRLTKTVLPSGLLIAAIALLTNAQPDSLRSFAPASDSVIIAKANSYLENQVAAILIDSLSVHGLKVGCVDIRKANRYRPDNYRAIIIFSGVKQGDLIAPVRSIMAASGNARSRVLVSTVYGERWGGAKPAVDAFTAATKTLQPGTIAGRILASLNLTGGADESR